MIEKVISPGFGSLKGQLLGYAREDRLRIAVLNVEGGEVLGCEFLKFFNPHEAVAYFVERPEPLGIGMSATLALGTGSDGLRAADFWLDEAPFHIKSPYDEFPLFSGPFQLDGGRSLPAIALLCGLRRRWTHLPASETAPGGCYRHLVQSTAEISVDERIATLSRWLKVPLPPDLEWVDWEAVMSAYAMWMGIRGAWSIDLHRLTRPGSRGSRRSFDGKRRESWHEPAMTYENLVFPAGPACFFWPPDERADRLP